MGAQQVEPMSSEYRIRRSRPWLCKQMLIAAAERVRLVLEPVLGPQLASERANNIAQALMFDASDAEDVIHDMLREVPGLRRRLIARQVSQAWIRC